jgi:hypothetical protein
VDTVDLALVTLPRAEYDALIASRERLAMIEAIIAEKPEQATFTVPPLPGSGPGSPIDSDPELAAFIREQMGKMKLVEIAAACRARFGAERAPSKSAIHRYWVRLAVASKPVSTPLSAPQRAVLHPPTPD